MLRQLGLAAILLALQAPAAHAGEARWHSPSAASAASIGLSAIAMASTAEQLSIAAGEWLLVSVDAGVDGTVWVVESTATAARHTLRFAGVVAEEALQPVGTVMDAVTVSGGVGLRASGEWVAFVVDASSAGLIHHERLDHAGG